jgi:4,5-DOPA dioxygenase extradiol
MYPEADIPVVQLSVQTPLGPRHHLELGRALAPLAAEGVLVFGSGHMTHNLRDRREAPPAPYVLDFQDWVDQRLAKREDDRLADYRAQAPGAVRAHPSDEHFLPLFVALGAANPGAKPERLTSAIETSALAMDAYLFETA